MHPSCFIPSVVWPPQLGLGLHASQNGLEESEAGILRRTRQGELNSLWSNAWVMRAFAGGIEAARRAAGTSDCGWSQETHDCFENVCPSEI